MDRKEIVLKTIEDLGNSTHLKNILISTNPIGILGQIGSIELATDLECITHIGIRDVYSILGDEKDFLCRCNNKLLSSIFDNLEDLISQNKVMFQSCKYTDQRKLSDFVTDVGILDKNNQALYNKYSKGIFIKI